jgi:hypothetical protein
VPRFFVLVLLVGPLVLLYPRPTRRHCGTNDHYALRTLRTLETSQAIYIERHGRWASLRLLGTDGLITSELQSGISRGYAFRVSGRGTVWSALAYPIVPGTTGDRFLMRDESGVVTYTYDTRALIDTSVCTFQRLGK